MSRIRAVSAHSIRRLRRGLIAAAVLLLAVPAAAPARPAAGTGVEVVVTLAAPPLATAHLRALAGVRNTAGLLDLRARASTAYLARLATAQSVVAQRIQRALPDTRIRWRYDVVLNGFAVVVPQNELGRLAHIPGVARVWRSLTFHPMLDRTPGLIGATQIWGPTLATAGQGIKIGIIDEGIDQTHPFFNAIGYAYPPGFPKGDTRYTTPKVIVARAFAPPNATYVNATLPFDPKLSDHGTHVAGIAAGNNGTLANVNRVSGIAPRAYLGNYKALSIPTPDFGLDGNSPELAAAIEAAVRDGMDVINLSLGEPETDPSRDVVVQALDAAADAGVVPVVAAGNDFADFGHGSIDSPGNAPNAISVAASTGGHGSSPPDRIASFSSGGPAPYSLVFKPDVTAPGVAVLSSVPAREGFWDQFSGTSMAAPHVAGAAALLRQRHPDWTVAQIKSALTSTGVPVLSGGKEVASTREGGGRIDLPRADRPLVFAVPSAVSFGLVRRGVSVRRTIALADAGGGAGTWSVTSTSREVATDATATVPGELSLTATAQGNDRDVAGFVVLTRNGERRRIPYWLRVTRPRLSLDRVHPIARAGVYSGTTAGAPSRVSTYRYPDLRPTTGSFPINLAGPESVYRFRLARPVANFGVVLTKPGSAQPRIVRAADENRLAGYTALPFDLNPYRSTYGRHRPVAGVVLPSPGTYDIVFDTTRQARPGPFTFRFWIGDTTPPSVRVLGVRRHIVTVAVRDGGSGVDPSSLHASVDGHARPLSYVHGIARVSLAGIGAGTHAFVFRAADYQETKNMEDVGPILPNTRTLQTTIVVR